VLSSALARARLRPATISLSSACTASRDIVPATMACWRKACSVARRRCARAAGFPSWLQLQRCTDRLPAGVAAVHILRVEASLAQLDRGLAADVESVGAVDDDGLGLRQLADPLPELLRIAPPDALRNVLQARDGRPRAHVDDLDGLAGGHHLFHSRHAHALDVAELRLFEHARPRNFRPA